MSVILWRLRSRRQFGALMLLIFIALISASNNAARGQTSNQTATGFFWPTGRDFKDDPHGWLVDSCKSITGNDLYFDGLYHIGWDIKSPLNSPVVPIADGIVYRVSEQTPTHDAGWGIGSEGVGNKGVFIEHVLDDDTRFLALYGHIRTDVKQGDHVTGGVPFATIGPWPYGIHLHFGIRPDTSVPRSNWGRQKCDNWPDTNGFVNPYEWITTKRPKSAATTPVPFLPTPPPATPVAPTVPAPPLGSVVIDDSSAAFARSGTPKFWRTASGGNGGSFIWTQNNHSKRDNTGTWTISVPERGLYEVFVFIPSDHVSTTNALYEIRHASKTDVVTVDQSKHRDTWHSLGTFDFEGKEAEYVRLTDATGEQDRTTQIAFDAIAIVRREQNFLEKVWSDIQQLVREIGKTIEQIRELLDKLKNPQEIVDQLIKDVVDQIVRALLLELQKYLQGLCGSITFAVLPLIMLARRKRTHD